VLSFLTISALVIVSAASLFLWEYYDPGKIFVDFEASQGQDSFGEGKVLINGSSKKQEEQPDYELPLTINLVFLGMDRTERLEYFERQGIIDSVQTDAIIFATLDIREQKVKAITISRDAKVPIINRDINDKINHAYRYGLRSAEANNIASGNEEGIRYALDTIENLMGAPVDFYVMIDIDDLVQIIDLMGGIYYEVEQDIRADLGRGHIFIEKGYQHLNGEQFFRYVQYRDVYGRHDDRMDRHQRILRSTFEQFRNTGNLTKIPAVFNILKDSINTNLENRHLGALVRFAAELNMEDIKFYSFEGEGIFTEFGYYFYINEEHRAEVLAEMLGVEVEEMGVPKGIPYEPEEEEEDDQSENRLNLFND
jgi:polyisoprenyl-teichoic acid--peptidoglycan teichoic acid transferase